MNYKDFFRGKKITQMGLGLLGRGVGDAEFLLECGADLIVTDLKTEKELEPSIERLKSYKLQATSYVLGEHRLEDFRGRDFILKGAGVSLDSSYIAEARKNGIPIEMDASLFAKLAPKGVKIIGVTGTRGKTTTTMLIYEIIKAGIKNQESGIKIGKPRVFLGGNIKDMATLPLLKIVKENDYVVMELDSWQLQGFGEAKISPHIAVFTTFLEDHMNYYKNDMKAYFVDKANIFKNQESRIENKEGQNIFIAGEQALPFIEKYEPDHAKRALIAHADLVPKDWKIKIPGEHNRLNIACAVLATRALKVPEEIIKKEVENFSGVAGRLEFLREINGVKIYNDTTATTPTATLAALKALAESRIKNQESRKNIILVMGGSDKGLDMSELMKEIPKYCKAVILLSGSGSEKLPATSYQLPAKLVKVEDLNQAVTSALKQATDGDIILFSPAFASFGMFKNEYDRGEKFNEIIKGL